jgi:hypothetical protein
VNGSGKGGNNRRRPFKRRERENTPLQDSPAKQGRRGAENARYDKNRGAIFERPKWTPPKAPSEPLPVLNCAYCGKPIKDAAAALSDRHSGSPVHFDCVLDRIAGEEILEKGDAVTYIGGGRFGVVHFNNPQDTRNFTIKKILEWENKEIRAGWRKTISEHYSET